MKIMNLIPFETQDGYVHVTELSDDFGSIYIQNFNISYNYKTIILRYFEDFKSVYNFVNLFKYFIDFS